MEACKAFRRWKRGTLDGCQPIENYYSDAWQIVETRYDYATNSHSYLQYVWDERYVDAPVVRYQDTNMDGDYNDSNDSVLYYTTDANFNVTALVNEQGSTMERYAYDPYGNVQVLDWDWDADDNNSSDVDNTRLYAGYEYEEYTGLYHVRNRAYHPTLGRWVQRDPIGYADGMNLYQYVGANPVADADHTGLHRDFNMKGQRPKAIPRGGKKWDVSHWNANTMHLSLYDFYLRSRVWKWKDGSSAEYVIIGGDFLTDVQGQSGQLDINEAVGVKLKLDARIMLYDLETDQKDTFSDRGSRIVTSDLKSPNVRLSMQTYKVYWEAECWIGPKKSNVMLDESGDKCGEKAVFGCDISWTLYDHYDFRGLTNLVFGTLGSPFHIYGYWSGAESGTVMRYCSE